MIPLAGHVEFHSVTTPSRPHFSATVFGRSKDRDQGNAAKDLDMTRALRRNRVTDYVRSVVDLLVKLVPGKSKAARRQKAISTYATFVSAMVLARAVDERALSQKNPGRWPGVC